MILDAHQLSLWRCERLGQFSRDWRPLRLTPRSLFHRLLREMVMVLSQGGEATAAALGTEMATRFLEQARNPGLDITGSPYEIAQDYAYALRHLAEWLSRTVLLPVHRVPAIRLTDSLTWQALAFQSEDGTLHRWTSAARVDDDWLSRELHGWAVLADTMAASAPMMLHVVETGSLRHGHLYGHLTRVFQHPEVIGRFQFQRTDGTPLAGDWKIRWAQDLKITPTEWVDWLQRDRVELIRHLPVKCPEESQRRQWIGQLEEFLPHLVVRKDPMILLADPSVCDSPLGPCKFQAVCYAPPGTTPESAGGFVRLENR